MHDTVTNNSRLTCRTAGVYLISGCAQFAAGAGTLRHLDVLLNGTTNIGEQECPPIGGGGSTTISIQTFYPLAVNDFVQRELRRQLLARVHDGAHWLAAAGTYCSSRSKRTNPPFVRTSSQAASGGMGGPNAM